MKIQVKECARPSCHARSVKGKSTMQESANRATRQSRMIKFRAWNTASRQWCDLNDVISPLFQLEVGDGGMFEIKHLGQIILQFTGLYDKNGKEIYEGDLLAYHGGYVPRPVFEIIFTHGAFGFKNVLNEVSAFCAHEWDEKERAMEVIGNIYENPELLKEAA